MNEIEYVECPCGAKSPGRVPNVGETKNVTGYSPVFTNFELIWLCPKCTGKVADAARDLMACLGPKGEYAVVPMIRKLALEAKGRPRAELLLVIEELEHELDEARLEGSLRDWHDRG